MFCESYRQPLMDAAASGESLNRVLAGHLAGCEGCSAALAEERKLLASIDESLRAAANAVVPDLVVPRIQAAIFQSETNGRRSQWRMVLFPATVCICALSVALFFYQSSQKKLSNAVPASTARPAPSRSQEQIPFAAAAMNSPEPLRADRKLRDDHRELVVPAEPQVQVDPASRIAMDQLLQLSRMAPDIAESFSTKSAFVSIEIKPIEAAGIRLEPLFREDDVKNQAEPNR